MPVVQQIPVDNSFVVAMILPVYGATIKSHLAVLFCETPRTVGRFRVSVVSNGVVGRCFFCFTLKIIRAVYFPIFPRLFVEREAGRVSGKRACKESSISCARIVQKTCLPCLRTKIIVTTEQDLVYWFNRLSVWNVDTACLTKSQSRKKRMGGMSA